MPTAMRLVVSAFLLSGLAFLYFTMPGSVFDGDSEDVAIALRLLGAILVGVGLAVSEQRYPSRTIGRALFHGLALGLIIVAAVTLLTSSADVDAGRSAILTVAGMSVLTVVAYLLRAHIRGR